MLDEKDLAILRELRENAKKTTKTISERTNVPRTTVHDRIGKMESNGTIRKYTLVPNYERIGEATTAFVFISHDQSQGVSQGELAKKISEIQGVYEVHLISGDWDLLVKVRGKDVESIGRMVLERLRPFPGVGKTLTSTVFQTMKEEV
ncbi:MAG TPA: Lrp/AsnC family transcriptional regulator [Candidatus Thermoplasmatota archaeon]|nr:Lrp/AsnC family transcriptional regulator [Candidatus Thermoplasmatota archaeon]